MHTKNIERVLSPATPHFVGDGFRVHNFIPAGGRLSMQRMDPFIMMDYNAPYYFEPTEKRRGVGTHPHRGFETVTIAYKGSVAHRDSSGGGGVIHAGDVQWMTAASGVLHQEFHEEEFSRKGGLFQMVQLWVNLPAKNKMAASAYQAITAPNMKTISLPDNAGEVRVIAGEYNGLTGAARTFSPIHLLDVTLQNNGSAAFSFPASFNTGLLVLEGSVLINQNKSVATDHFAVFENKGKDFIIEATSAAKVLILSGEPIGEPIAAGGPFVMNTQEELTQAFQDYQEGKFGKLTS